MDAGRLRDAVARLLRANWREGRTPSGTEYGYTCPDPVKYPDQFFWDSCLHAVAWSHVDPSRARRELRTLVAAQRPDGLIGHTVFWRGRVRLARAFTYNLIRRSDRTTATIQPPLLAWAWAEVADRSPDDPGFRAEGLPALRRYHAWLDRERADGDGLLGILQPDESGLDATPAYDAPLGWRAHPLPGFLLLLRFNRRRGFSYRRVVADGGFHATDPLVNTAWALAWEGMARLGEPGAGERAGHVTAALVARLWDPERAIFHPRGPAGERLTVATWAGLAPLALPRLPEEVDAAPGRGAAARPAPVLAALPRPQRERAGAELPARRRPGSRCGATGAGRAGPSRPASPLTASCARAGSTRRATWPGARPPWCCARASGSTTTRTPGGRSARGPSASARSRWTACCAPRAPPPDADAPGGGRAAG